MSRILKAKSVQENIKLLNFDSPVSLKFDAENGNKIVLSDGKMFCVGCINCSEPKCMQMLDEELNSPQFKNVSQDMNKDVCPVNAIRVGKQEIFINTEKCIGCGLCAARCPVGAISLRGGRAVVQKGTDDSLFTVSITEDNLNKQVKQIQELSKIKKSGYICIESDIKIEALCRSISKLSQEEQNILARNLLVILGNKATLTRKGNVYTRMDGFIDTKKYFGVVEVETGTDMLDVSRAILDDVAVVNVRYNIEKNNNHPIAVVLGMPNKRTDYWQVLKDIKDVVGLKISTVSFGALLILIWNLKEVDDFDKFYIDVDNSSIRGEIEKIIGRKTKLSYGTEGVLENSK